MASEIRASTMRLLLGMLFLSLASCLIEARPAFAQSQNTKNTLALDDPANRPKAEVDALAWLAGYWQGTSTIGTSEEAWMPPSHGTMAGVFKVVREGQPYFYEFVEISEEAGSLTLKVKHFSAELQGWEEKEDFVSFPLVKLGHHEAYFSGLTYRLTSDAELRVYVAVKQQDDRLEELEFVYKRQDSGRSSR